MKNLILSIFLFYTFSLMAQTDDEIKKIQEFTNIEQLKVEAIKHANEFKASKERALTLAKAKGWKLIIEGNGGYSELVGVTEDDMPIYYSTSNVAAANSTRTNHLNSGGSLGLNLMGQNMRAHVWDAGLARTTHQEYDGTGGINRFSVGDTSTALHSHAAHVAGTIMASGLVAGAKGMAPHCRVSGYDWNNDIAEATTAAANGMLVSNHSYGNQTVIKDQFGNITNYTPLPSYYPGAYISVSRDWDNLMRNAPYYLPVWAAGNDGQYAITTSPLIAGYDKLVGRQTAKNSLVVANAQDANIAANGNLISVAISSSSSQGPTDDLRIKPDITGNGTGVYSTLVASDLAYGNSSGTSMASPNVTGSLLLLQQHYNNLNGSFMRAATLKGLALHTADDAGPTGPDTIWGWGLLNAKRAAETITQRGSSSRIDELTIAQGQTIVINVNSDNVSPLVASISWTDLPGVASTLLNNSSPRLINDLDIRIEKSGTTFFPWLLTAANANGLGDNIRDPYERININGASGGYTITITHKGTLSGGNQNFSLIVTGLSSCASVLNITTNVTAAGIDHQQASNSITASNTVFSGGEAIYHATNEVLLTNGFTATNGSIFRAYIEGCTSVFVRNNFSEDDFNTIDNKSLDIESENKLTLYPNPNNGLFNIRLPEQLSGQLEIFDMSGKLIMNKDFYDVKDFEINILEHNKGIYLLRINTSTINFTEKLIKY